MDLEKIIDSAWEDRQNLTAATKGDARDAVEQTLAQLDHGSLRVAEKKDGQWLVNQWIKKAVLLSFRLNGMQRMGDLFYDKVPLKTYGWSEEQFKTAGFRIVPGTIVRRQLLHRRAQ
jgi:2,3,4,5-tetrahydropyridine-2-carboxylate N-succinyltransferase